MTKRSIILALISTVLLSLFCYFNDTVIRAGSMVSSLMPVAAYGGLVLFLLCANPLLRKCRRQWALSGRETAMILALFLISCGVPGWGLVQLFPMTIMMPHHDARVQPGWREAKVTELVPNRMLTDISRDDSIALDGYVTGLAQGDKHISLAQVPWHAWQRTFLFWGPLIVSMLVTVMGLAAVFHKQWADHEQIPYPIPVFANALLPAGDGRANSVLFQRLFWIGFALSFVILMNNYACRWWPEHLIPIPLRLDFSPLMRLFPILARGKAHVMFQPNIILPVVGLAYFIGSDVSISMAIAPLIYCLIAGVFAGYGIELRSGKMMALTIEPFIFAGGYFGILAMVLYTGRRYYTSTLKCAFGRPVEDEVPAYAVTGMRMFVVGLLLFLAQLVMVGIDWQIALIYTFFLLMIYVVVSRAIAETGAFHVGTFVYPGVMVWGIFGARALGPTLLATMFIISTVLVAAPGWCPMPFIVQSLKLVDLAEAKPEKAVKWGTLVLILSLLIAVPATIYCQYDRGAPTVGWPRSSSRYPFENAVEIIHSLKAQGTLAEATSVSGWARFRHVQPSLGHLAAFAITALLAVAVGIGRLHFARWPLHPVIFLFLGGYQGMLMAFSFGLGWVIKTAVTKYGGANCYHRLKPLMIGLIAGSMLAGFLPMLIGMTYYFITGHPA